MGNSEGDLTLAIQEAQKITEVIEEASVRSRRVRMVTFALLLALIGIGLFLTYNTWKHHKEDLRKAQQVKETEKKLELEAENARKASDYIASGAYKAGHRQWPGALADYDQALSLDPNNAAALRLKGYLLLRMGSTAQAEELLRNSVQKDPTDPWSHYNFALALWAAGKKHDAVSELQELIKIDPCFKTTIAKDRQFKAFKADPAFRKLIAPSGQSSCIEPDSAS